MKLKCSSHIPPSISGVWATDSGLWKATAQCVVTTRMMMSIAYRESYLSFKRGLLEEYDGLSDEGFRVKKKLCASLSKRGYFPKENRHLNACVASIFKGFWSIKKGARWVERRIEKRGRQAGKASAKVARKVTRNNRTK